MTTDTKDKEDVGARAKNSAVAEAPKGKNSAGHTAKYGNDAIAEPAEQKDGAGMPAGYKPDTSVQYHAAKGKDGADQIEKDGVKTAVSAATVGARPAMETLPEGHTNRDRVEAQARQLGIEVDPAWTLEYLYDVIRWKASS